MNAPPPRIGASSDGQGLRIAVIVSRFNEPLGERLLEGAFEALREKGVPQGEVTVVRVPGSFELPLAAKKLAKSSGFDAIVCLGAVIRGGTPHFEYVSQATTVGIEQVALECEVPIALGVLTTDNYEQALDRSGPNCANKGYEAALTAIEMANVLRRIPPSGSPGGSGTP
ncbi:MAG: 6,7-dimethyl-8-ribityllumazine synthase [Vicinamibacteria bacterium]